jgi:hypothetical protein
MVFGLFSRTPRHVSSSESDVRNPKLEVAQALAVQADAKAKAATTTYLAAWLGREASIPGSPIPPVGNLRGPCMEFGKVRIRLWNVCFAGGEFPCGIMTTDKRFKYDWSVTPARAECCAMGVKHFYRHKWKSIMEISALGKQFLTSMDPLTWSTDILMYQGICRQAEMARCSESKVKKEIREARKFTFEQVFRRALKDEVKPGVDLEKTWFLRSNIQLPDWSFDLLYGVVKHCR